MSAAAKSIIIAVIGLILAIMLGAELGQGSHMVPIVIAIVCIGTFVYVALFRTVRFEALILGILILGYIVGNRGFAALTFGPNSLLYVGEVGLVACAFLVCARRALTREQLVPHTPLAWAIVAFIVLGGIRLCFDTFLLGSSSTTTTAIRDSAVVYYAVFFFIAYQIGTNDSARRFTERVMLTGFVLLIPVSVLAIWGGGLLAKLTFRGYPLILYKGDLLATFLGIAAFYFFLTPARGVLKVLLRFFSLVCLALMLLPMSRAGLFGFACASLLLLAAKRPKFIMYQIGVVVAGLFAIAFLQLSNVHLESDFFRNLSERASSIVDFSGKSHYRSSIGESAAANNEFRTVWWTTVFNETMQKGPFFGLGFGYDLTASFMRTYYLTGGEDTATTRSPHSILFTVLGRMGVLGLAVLVIILFLIVRTARLTARAVARGSQPEQNLAPWCAVVTLLVASMFGVVLEGPMGGILFWTFLGLAASQVPIVQTKSAPDVSRTQTPRADPLPVG